MNVQNVTLEAVGVKLEQYPKTGKPEIAFAGKSNVGKSSLLNVLINRKKLARTSSQPGKTQTINFYNVEDLLYFVDLPGYGYAKVSIKERERWGKMIEDYLHQRKELRQVVLLVDGRHEPSKDDCIMMDWIKAMGFEPFVIATKMDKLKRSQRAKALKLIRQTLSIKSENLYGFSAETRDGKEEIWKGLQWVLDNTSERFLITEDQEEDKNQDNNQNNNQDKA